MKILCYTGFFCFVCFVFCVDNSSEITHVASSSRVLEQDLSYPGELPLLVLLLYSSSKSYMKSWFYLLCNPRGWKKPKAQSI